VLTDPAIAPLGDMDSTAVTIRTRKGRLCQINTIRRAAYGYDQRFEVLGSPACCSAATTRPARWRNGTPGHPRDKPENFFLQRYAAAYRLEMAHFFECLQSGARSAPPWPTAWRRRSWPMRRSAQIRQPVSW
jgi:myo-inositol 2-dehydrogenase/D-chiro-inositol 1-dehydrogenase